MSQMVLPQNLPKGSSAEAPATPASSRSDSGKTGESRFDEVSRSERQRLEAKRTENKQPADSNANKQTEASKSDAEKAAKVDKSEKPVTEQTTTEQATTEQPADEPSGQPLAANEGQQAAVQKAELTEPLVGQTGKAAESESQDVAVDSLSVTFAGLQSLMAPAQITQGTANGVAVPANGQGPAVIQNSLMSGTGLGKNGTVPGQTAGQKSMTSGLALAENLLAGTGPDSANRPSDSPVLQNAIRFQGALESLTSPAQSLNAPKMAPEAPILRSYATSIDVPVGHAEWGDKMAGKLTFLTAKNMSVAEIHLTPPDMGPMEVRVQVQQDQANISVHSANPVVREQLELHSHRLRDMLGEQGFSLEKFDVSDSGQEQTRDGEPGNGGGTGEGLMAGSDTEESSGEPQSLDLTWKGEVDIFA